MQKVIFSAYFIHAIMPSTHKKKKYTLVEKVTPSIEKKEMKLIPWWTNDELDKLFHVLK
jgi:hypothetical protein